MSGISAIGKFLKNWSELNWIPWHIKLKNLAVVTERIGNNFIHEVYLSPSVFYDFQKTYGFFNGQTVFLSYSTMPYL